MHNLLALVGTERDPSQANGFAYVESEKLMRGFIWHMSTVRSFLLAGCVFAGGASTFLVFTPASPVKADETISTQPTGLSYAVTTESGGNKLRLYRVSTNGAATLLQDDLFPGNSLGTFAPGDQIVDAASGKIYFKEPPQGAAQARYRIYNAITNEFEGYTSISGTSDDAQAKLVSMPFGITNVVNKECSSSNGTTCINNSDTITLGGEGSNAIATIDGEGLSVGGKSVVSRKTNAAGEEELHIGENSLVTVESAGVQKLYATDANGDSIPINITNGSDIQINGVSIQSTLNTKAAKIGTNTAGITTNAAGITTNAAGITTNAAGITTNAAGITTNAAGIKVNAAGIATNAADIKVNAAGIATNASNIQINTTDIKNNTKRININIQGISTNAAGIKVNATNIRTNSQGIMINSERININAAGINRNTSAIQDNRNNINKLQTDVKSLGSGIAGATALSAALSSLPTTSDDSPFSCGLGSGGYSSRYAMGVGCSARLNERLSFNAGGSVLFGGASTYGSSTLDTMAGRAGFVFKLGKITSTNE